MLSRAPLERAVDLQARGYRLILWLQKALEDGFIAPETAHAYASLQASAHAWIDRHYDNLPHDARPPRAELETFSKLFSTYLVNTFDLERDPGERLFSPNAHCFCPMCSWMVRVPHLRPKKVGPGDRKTADAMRRALLRRLATEEGISIDDDALTAMIADRELREPLGLVTYAYDLLQRLDGVAVGPAALALWRSFAWTRTGSPKKDFALSVEAILEAEARLLGEVVRRAAGSVEC